MSGDLLPWADVHPCDKCGCGDVYFATETYRGVMVSARGFCGECSTEAPKYQYRHADANKLLSGALNNWNEFVKKAKKK